MRFTPVLAAVLVAAAISGCDVAARNVQGVARSECATCHGTGASAAPATGAHARHVAAGIGCSECHRVPASVNAPGHADASPAEVHFATAPGDVAAGPGPAPEWNAATRRCANVYCHGATLDGGTNVEPLWTGGAAEATCGSCHALPPGGTHPASTACAMCHPETVSGEALVLAEGAPHANGVKDWLADHDDDWTMKERHGYAANASLGSCKPCHGDVLDGGVSAVSCDTCHDDVVADWRTDCTFCHGDRGTGVAAPPNGTQGETETAQRAVGAHRAHLAPGAGAIAAPIACGECHVVPQGPLHTDGAVRVTFGPTATRGDRGASWDGSSCANTYCHGATLPGGGHTTPLWTGGTGEAACGTCHGAPPPEPHPAANDCERCHGGYTATSADLARHVNGVLDLDCFTCHGDATRPGPALIAAAPPRGVDGETDTGARAVGAHQKHVAPGPGAIAAPIPCSGCHAVPTSAQHSDGVAQVQLYGAGASWDGTRCTNTWCHGNIPNGNAAQPVWTATGSAPCGSCHAVPPPGETHDEAQLHSLGPEGCNDCHPGYTTTSVNPAVHVNQQIDVGCCH